jgi:hypothetical protein
VQIIIFNHYYSVSFVICRYNRDRNTPVSITIDYYRYIVIGITGRAKIFIGSDGSMQKYTYGN